MQRNFYKYLFVCIYSTDIMMNVRYLCPLNGFCIILNVWYYGIILLSYYNDENKTKKITYVPIKMPYLH